MSLPIRSLLNIWLFCTYLFLHFFNNESLSLPLFHMTVYALIYVAIHIAFLSLFIYSPSLSLFLSLRLSLSSLVMIQYHAKCVTTLFTKSSQVINFAFIFLAAKLPGHCLVSNSNHTQVFTPIYQSSHLIMQPCLQQKCTDMAYPSQYDNRLAVKH